MNRLLRRSAALSVGVLLAAPALAQSSLTVYGLLDIGLLRESGGAQGTLYKVGSGMSNGNRLGFKGVEELGSGWAALFLLESGFQVDDGSMGQGALFGRQSYVGLRSPFGSVTLGRQYTAQFDTLALADPFQSGTVGDAKNLAPSTGDANTRMTNSVKLATPQVQGWNGELMFVPGEAGSAGRQLGGAVGYARGPLMARLGYHQRSNLPAGSSQARNTLLALTWDFGLFKAHAGYGVDKGVGSSAPRNPDNPYGHAAAPVDSRDSTDLLLGLSAVCGRHTWLASAVRKDDKTSFNQDAVQYALGHRYALSRRTDSYLVLSHISNRNGAGYTAGHASSTGSGNRALSAGLRHTF